MTGVARGNWKIRSVSVNSEPVLNAEGFRQLVVSDHQVEIQPAGIEFSIAQSTPRTAILESRSQLFFADFFEKNGELTLNLTRPAFAEKISLCACLD